MENIEKKGLVKLSSLKLNDRFLIMGIEYALIGHIIDDLHRCKRISNNEIIIAPGNVSVKPLRKLYT